MASATDEIRYSGSRNAVRVSTALTPPTPSPPRRGGKCLYGLGFWALRGGCCDPRDRAGVYRGWSSMSCDARGRDGGDRSESWVRRAVGGVEHAELHDAGLGDRPPPTPRR